MVIKVIMGTNTNRVTDMYEGNTTTLRSALEAHDIDYTRGMNLDGVTLGAGDLDKTFAQMGVTADKCFLVSVAKQDNA